MVQHYPYSSLHGLLGLKHLLIPIEEDTLLFDQGIEDALNWLNKEVSEENRKAVKSALRKSIFSIARTEIKSRFL